MGQMAVAVVTGVRWAGDNGTEASTADCMRGLRLNVTQRTVNCSNSPTATHSDSPDVSSSPVCSAHGRCLAAKYYDVSGFSLSDHHSYHQLKLLLNYLLTYYLYRRRRRQY